MTFNENVTFHAESVAH